MGLKANIIIKNEFTNNTRSEPGKGSRGASPGDYVMRYMAREDATEVLTPVKQHIDITPAQVEPSTSYDGEAFMRYMARSDATERLKAKDDELLQDADAYGSPLVLKHRFRSMDKLSGRAFGSRGISLSQSDLETSSQEIQDAFDNGHSVQKIIISFTEEYLRETGVLNPDFKHKGRGSYKGHIDQLKLRQGVIDGVGRMVVAGKFVDPAWVGTIQLDTSHVHAHIALVDTDFSSARMHRDGSDRGKINEREKAMFRKGLHYSLEDMRDLKSFYKQTALERQNVTVFVKDYAYSTLSENTGIQLLIAALPNEKSYWRYRSNRDSMKHPNKLATEIVERVFETEPDKSGYRSAMEAVVRYADESERKNKLTKESYQEVVEEGRERIVERSVNGLYRTLKTLDPGTLHIRTTMTDIQSSSDEELAEALKVSSEDNSFDAASFALRVRGYNERQETHTESASRFFTLTKEYDDANRSGFVDATAHVMRLYYEEEQRYHMGLADKYRKFLAFHHPKDRFNVLKMENVYESLMQRYEGIRDGEMRHGISLYDERSNYQDALRGYTFECFHEGVATLKEWELVSVFNSDASSLTTPFVLPVRPKTRSENLTEAHFNQVKAWDVHHLGLDYYNQPDARIDAKNAQAFADVWQNRKSRAEAARTYVDATGQRLPILDASEQDIQSMEVVVKKAVQEGLIQTVTIDDLLPREKEERRQLYTIPLDRSIDVTEHVRTSLEQIEIEEQQQEEDVLE